MKIIVIGANGTIGELVQKALAGAGHEIVKVGRKSGDFRVEIENRESVGKLYQAVGSFDAVAIAAGEVAFCARALFPDLVVISSFRSSPRSPALTTIMRRRLGDASGTIRG